MSLSLSLSVCLSRSLSLSLPVCLAARSFSALICGHKGQGQQVSVTSWAGQRRRQSETYYPQTHLATPHLGFKLQESKGSLGNAVRVSTMGFT